LEPAQQVLQADHLRHRFPLRLQQLSIWLLLVQVVVVEVRLLRALAVAVVVREGIGQPLALLFLPVLQLQ
jgi:hypothetical protein